MSLIKLWKNRGQILEGIRNSIFKKEDVEEIARQRDAICRSNECGYYDEKGQADKCYVKGERCCGACGCNLNWKQRSLSSDCGLKELGRTPLWSAVLTEEEDQQLKEKLGLQD